MAPTESKKWKVTNTFRTKRQLILAQREIFYYSVFFAAGDGRRAVTENGFSFVLLRPPLLQSSHRQGWLISYEPLQINYEKKLDQSVARRIVL